MKKKEPLTTQSNKMIRDKINQQRMERNYHASSETCFELNGKKTTYNYNTGEVN
jgi:hypothetical protein